MWRQIKWRLTFWAALLMAVVVTAFAGSVYWLMRNTTYGELSLAAKTQALEALTAWETQHTLPEMAEGVLAVRIHDRAGTVLVSAGNWPAPPPPPSHDGKKRRPPIVEVGTAEAGQHVAEAALDVTQAVDRLEDLGRILVLATLAAVLIAAGLGFSFARVALRPVDRMMAAAGRIALDPATGRLERLPTEPPKDELYHMGETINAMLDRIEEAYLRQTRFVADASHELRTPLTVIQGYGRMLARWGSRDPKVLDEAVHNISRESGRMARLLEDLLLLARGDTGLQLALEPVDLGEIVREVGADMAVASESLGGRRTDAPGPVEVRTEAPTPAHVLGDPQYLRQLVIALAENAVQYTPGGGLVTLRISGTAREVTLDVSDTGIGIPAADLPHIFDRFYRVDKHRSRGTGGSGLGLAIAAWLAKEHGGGIRGESTPGQGSRFTVTLPAIQEGAGEAS